MSFDDWSPSSEDLIPLCTKCYDNRVVLERIPSSAEIIPVQNGFDTELVDRLEVEGIASFVTECTPGRTHTLIIRPGQLHLGISTAADGRNPPIPIEPLAETLERHRNFTVKRVDSVLPYKDTKVMYNAAMSPIAAVAGLDNGQLLTISDARRLFFGLPRENYQILPGAGAPLERLAHSLPTR